MKIRNHRHLKQDWRAALFPRKTATMAAPHPTRNGKGIRPMGWKSEAKQYTIGKRNDWQKSMFERIANDLSISFQFVRFESFCDRSWGAVALSTKKQRVLNFSCIDESAWENKRCHTSLCFSFSSRTAYVLWLLNEWCFRWEGNTFEKSKACAKICEALPRSGTASLGGGCPDLITCLSHAFRQCHLVESFPSQGCTRKINEDTSERQSNLIDTLSEDIRLKVQILRLLRYTIAFCWI